MKNLKVNIRIHQAVRKSKAEMGSHAAKAETMQKEEVKAYQPPIPFPQRLKHSKLVGQFVKFLNMFKKLEINIPFVEALA